MDLLASLMIGTGNVWIKEYLVRLHVPNMPAPSADSDNAAFHRAALGKSTDGGFNHPFVFTQFTVTGLSLVFLALWLRGEPVTTSRAAQVSPFHHDPKAVPARVYLYCALVFYWASILVNMNYAVLSGSVIQMLRGSKVVFTYILSVYMLEKRMRPHHFVGAMICVCACAVVGLREVGATSHEGSGVLRREAVVAVAMCVASEVLRSVLFVYQEQSMRGYQIPAMKLAGIQGLIGIPLGAVVMYSAYLAGMEDVPRAYVKLVRSPQLDYVAFLLLAISALWEVSGATITKRYSAVARTLLELSRTMTMWLLDLFMGYELFCIYHLIALLLLVLGILIYQHILIIPRLDQQSEDSDAEKKPLNITSKSEQVRLQ